MPPRVRRARSRQRTKGGNDVKKILIATDGSPSALQAVELGLELAEEEAPSRSSCTSHRRRTCYAGRRHRQAPVSVPHELDEADRASLDEAVELAEERGIEAADEAARAESPPTRSSRSRTWSTPT